MTALEPRTLVLRPVDAPTVVLPRLPLDDVPTTVLRRSEPPRPWTSRLAERRRGLLIVLGLLVVAGLVHGLHMTVAPSPVTTDDEGTYVSQAWAVLYQGELAHYTYWYDHPPLGWLQIAAWAGLTGAFDRYDLAVSAGREFMLVAKLAAVALMYVLARRLGANRFFAAAAVLLFAVNPLGLYYQRLAYLDNITVPWLLAAFALAASPGRRLSAHTASALCFGVAVLTKETILVVLPALIYQLWQGAHPATRRMSLTLFTTVLTAICGSYLLLAVLKSELVPGPGHVDLVSAVRWQLLDRAPSGSVFDPSSAAGQIVHSWAGLDPWLGGLALAATVPALLARRLRPAVLAFVIMVGMMLRGGYLPQPYLICLVPFAALVVAGTAGALWDSDLPLRLPALRQPVPPLGVEAGRLAVRIPVLVAAVALALGPALSTWGPGVERLVTVDHSAPVRQALAWMDAHVPVPRSGRAPTVAVSDAMWVDLHRRGYTADWYFKLDADPAVKARYPRGWGGVDPETFPQETKERDKSTSRPDMSTLLDARQHGRVVARFGTGSDEILIYRTGAP
jgi:Dolichyl-phosphate-mannose-protein mannosyltransferase